MNGGAGVDPSVDSAVPTLARLQAQGELLERTKHLNVKYVRDWAKMTQHHVKL